MLPGNANNFRCTDLLVTKAQVAGPLSPHPGLASKLEVFSVTRKGAEAVFGSVENAARRTLTAY